MTIKILELITGAKQAAGLTVIIDVFRAFTTECYVFNNGAEKIFPVGDIDIAYRLKKENPDYVLMGERGGVIQPGFDFGNSPALIEHVDFTGKTVVHTTSAGTQGIANATNADEIITGSFVNAGAVAAYIRRRAPGQVSLVAMGHAGVRPTDEDSLLAMYLKNELENQPNDFGRIVDHLKTYESAQKFFNPVIDWAPERDFELCMSLNRFDFVLRSEANEAGLVVLRRITV
ncbi:MAG: 2-phosphosulfolactate phosphatase [Candidatus Zhuqueibacterota bacterium]